MKKLYVFTYREEFTADILAESEAEAIELLNKKNCWQMLGDPHPDFLTIETDTE